MRSLSVSNIVSVVLSMILLAYTSHLHASDDSLSSESPYNKKFKIGYVPDPAFYFEQQEPKGILAPLLGCVFSNFKQLSYVPMPSAIHIMGAVEYGMVDAAINVVPSEKRDRQAVFSGEIFRSRVLWVSQTSFANKAPSDEVILATRLGSKINYLLAEFDIKPTLNAMSIQQILEMFRTRQIDSFVEAEVLLLPTLATLENMSLDFDYRVFAQTGAGAYFSFEINREYPNFLVRWQERSKDCRHLAPSIDTHMAKKHKKESLPKGRGETIIKDVVSTGFPRSQ